MLGKWVSCILITLFCGIPTWLYLLARWFLEPHGFFQELLLFGLGLYVLAGIQFFLFLLWLFAILAICNGPRTSTIRHR